MAQNPQWPSIGISAESSSSDCSETDAQKHRGLHAAPLLRGRCQHQLRSARHLARLSGAGVTEWPGQRLLEAEVRDMDGSRQSAKATTAADSSSEAGESWAVRHRRETAAAILIVMIGIVLFDSDRPPESPSFADEMRTAWSRTTTWLSGLSRSQETSDGMDPLLEFPSDWEHPATTVASDTGLPTQDSPGFVTRSAAPPAAASFQPIVNELGPAQAAADSTDDGQDPGQSAQAPGTPLQFTGTIRKRH